MKDDRPSGTSTLARHASTTATVSAVRRASVPVITRGSTDVADDEVMTFDPILGWVRSVPLPFWTRRWFRSRPLCPEHDLTFRNVDGWTEHYLREH